MKEKNKKILVIIIAILVFLYMVWFFNFRQKMNVPGKQEQPKPNVPGKQEQPVPNVPGKQEQPVPNVPGKQEQPVPNTPGKQEEPKPNVPDKQQPQHPKNKRTKLSLQKSDVDSLQDMKVFVNEQCIIQGDEISLPYQQPREINNFQEYNLENGYSSELYHLGTMSYYYSLVADAFRPKDFSSIVFFSTLFTSFNIEKDTWKHSYIGDLIALPRDEAQVKKTPYYLQFFCGYDLSEMGATLKVYKAPARELYLELKGNMVEFYQYQSRGKFKKLCYLNFGKAEQAEKVYNFFGFFTINNLD